MPYRNGSARQEGSWRALPCENQQANGDGRESAGNLYRSISLSLIARSVEADAP